MFCGNCGIQLPEGMAYCESCGAATRHARARAARVGVYPARAKSRLAAGLLGVFLGHIGVHRFYLGYIGLGIVQIIVTLITFGIGGLWGFIEGIVILVGGMKTDARGLPLRE